MADKIRRRVRHTETIGHVEYYKTKSFSKKREGVEYEPVKDDKGRVQCNCDGFGITKTNQARKAGVVPTVWTPSFWCCHLRQMIRTQRKAGLIPAHPDERDPNAYRRAASAEEKAEYERARVYAQDYMIFALPLPENATSGQAQRWIRLVSERIEDAT